MTTQFKEIFDQYDWDKIKEKIYATREQQVKHVLAKSKRNLQDFLTLLSPAAAPFLEEMAAQCHYLTKKEIRQNHSVVRPTLP